MTPSPAQPSPAPAPPQPQPQPLLPPALARPGGPVRAGRPGHGGYLDLYYRLELWEEPLLPRPWRRAQVPLPPETAGHPQVQRAIAWLAAYHQSHSWQMMRALGCSEYSFSRTIRPLYEAGLVARARFNPYRIGATPYMYQLNPGAPLRAWLRDLSWADWLGVTGGTKISRANYPRHNMLVAELALQTAERLPQVAQVMGEPYAHATRMVPATTNTSIGDCVLVLGSGLRVMVELVANLGDDVQRKIVRWGRLLTGGPASRLGLVVLLLNAAAPSRYKAVARHLRRMVHTGLEGRQLGPPGGGWATSREVQLARDSMYIAGWPDWFSPGGQPTGEFLQLQAWHAASDDSFVSSSILKHPFRPAQPAHWQDPVRNLPRLYATPQALRARHSPPA